MNNTETKLMSLLVNEESRPIELPEFGCFVTFKRPSLPNKHRGRAWAFRKLREFGYSEKDDNAGTSVIQYWGQLNSYVTSITYEVNGSQVPYQYNPKEDTEYDSVFEKFVVEEIYNRRGIQEDMFIAEVVVLLMKWIEETTVEEEELKNS